MGEKPAVCSPRPLACLKKGFNELGSTDQGDKVVSTSGWGYLVGGGDLELVLRKETLASTEWRMPGVSMDI